MNNERDMLRERLEYDASVLQTVGHNPYYHRINSGQNDPLYVDGREVINLATNNYLGLSNDERIKEVYIDAIRKYGVSMCATPVAGGYTELFERTEEKLSRFIGIESSLLYPSCYQANNGIFSAVARKEDLVLFDRFAHSSLIQGIRSVGCRALPFSHNDVKCLENLLRNNTGYDKVFVVTESVFSTEGCIAPFREIYDLCLRFGAIPVVDDSHGIGVIGRSGKGILSYAGIENYNGIYTTSLGKALANNCGVIGGSRELISFLSYFSSHLVYSTALPPSVIAGIYKTLEIIEEEYDMLREKVYGYAKMMKEALAHDGFRLACGEAPITSIIAGDTEHTIRFAKSLYDNAVLSTPFVYPSVRKNEGKIRLIAGANLKAESIERVIRLFGKISIN